MDTNDPRIQNAIAEYQLAEAARNLAWIKLMQLLQADNPAVFAQLQQLNSDLARCAAPGTTSIPVSSAPADSYPAQAAAPVSTATQGATLGAAAAGGVATAVVPPAAPLASFKQKFSVTPEQRDSDDVWGFKNRDLEDESNSDCLYQLNVTDEGIGEYFLINNQHTVETVSMLPSYAPTEVVQVEMGAPGKGVGIKLVSKGSIRKDGKWWVVTKPCAIRYE